MAGNFKMPNKKTTIIVSIIVVILAIIAVTGTVVFLKDRGSTEAADLGNEQVSREETRTSTSAPNEQATVNEETQSNGEQAGNQEGQNAGITANVGTTTGTTDGTVATGTTTTTATAGANGTATTTDNIQETTITRNETVTTERPWETQDMTWSAIDVNAELASAKVKAQTEELNIIKSAKTETGDKFATVGEEITYSIKVSSDKNLQGIEIKDTVPAMTTYVEGSAGEDATVAKDSKGNVVIKWNVNLEAGIEKEVSFKVTVNEGATEIENTAIVNGDETNTEKTSIIKSKKESTITRNGNQVDVAKKGDIITYTITVENNGTETGSVKVKDADLATILNNAKMSGKIKVNGTETDYTSDDLIKGISVDIEKIATVEFQIEVTAIDRKIKNAALIGENEKTTKPDEINTYGFTVEKVLAKVERKGNEIDKTLPVKIGDELTYTITVKNIGSVDIDNLSIKDVLPSNVTAIGAVDFDKVSVEAGKETSKEIKVTVNSISGAIDNNVVVTDKDDPTEEPETDTETTQTIGFTIDKAATVVKSTENATHEGYAEIAEVGDTIHYVITVTNIGSTELKGIKVEDAKARIEIDQTVDLAPAGKEGSIVTIEKDYEVKAEDIKLENGAVADIHNDVTGTYTDTEKPENNVTDTDDEDVTVRDEYNYTVEYYYDNVRDNTKTETETATYGDVINSYIDKVKDGYRFDKEENKPLTVTENEATNVIKVYYVKRTDLSYTVNYLEKDTNKVLHEAKEVGNQTYQATVTEQAIDIAGYDKVAPTSATITIDVENNVINFYYTKRTDLSYTVNYLEKGTTNTVATSKTVNNQTFGTVILASEEVRNDIDGYVYDSADKNTLTIGTGENVINLYYTKRTDLSYTVNYLEKGTNTVLHQAKIVGNQTFGTVITSANEVIDIDGYKYDSVDKTTLSIGTGENVINIYYIQKPVLELTKSAIVKDSTGSTTEISQIIYDPYTDSNNIFYYRLKVENIAENSTEVVEDEQTVIATLPKDVELVGDLPEGVTATVAADGTIQITWTVGDIGKGDEAQYIDIKVKVKASAFDEYQIDLGNETTILDINLSQYQNDKFSSNNRGQNITDTTGNKMNFFIRTAGATSGNNGYIYVGTKNAGTSRTTSTKFFSDTYNTDTKVNTALNNSEDTKAMLADFENNSSIAANYVSGGLPTREDVNEALATLYPGSGVQLSETQMVLWYKTSKTSAGYDPELTRYYQITKNGTTLFRGGVTVPACSYHLDGIIIDKKDLGMMIADGTHITLESEAQLYISEKSQQDGVTGNTDEVLTKTIDVYYHTATESASSVSMLNLLSLADKVESEEINGDNVDSIIEVVKEADETNTKAQSTNKESGTTQETNSTENTENTSSSNSNTNVEKEEPTAPEKSEEDNKTEVDTDTDTENTANSEEKTNTDNIIKDTTQGVEPNSTTSEENNN